MKHLRSFSIGIRKLAFSSLLCLTTSLILAANTVIAAPPVNRNITNDSWSQNEPMVAFSPLDHNRVVVGFNDNRGAGDYGVSWSWSDNGGNSWTYGGKISFGGYSLGADPVVAFDNSGTVYMVGLVYNPDASPSLGQDGSVFFAKSNDNGQTFPAASRKLITIGTGTTTYYDKPWLYVNPANNHIYIAWVKRTNAWGAGGTESSVIEFTRSVDGGQTFSLPVQVSTFNNPTGSNRSHGPQITALSANRIFVSWHTLETGTLPNPPTTPWKIWVAESTDGGATFGTNDLAVTTEWGYPNRFISTDSDPANGKIYIAYADSHVQSPRDYDIFLTSAASASSWSPPVKLNDDPQNGRWQFYPALDVAPNGRVDVIWYDYRDDASRLNVYYTYSTDGGVTWKSNTKITNVNLGFTPTNDFAGDYNCVASVDENTYVVWMDNRLGNQEIYGASIIHPTSAPSAPTNLQVQ